MMPVAYYNSEIINREELSIDIRDLGFILGTTISERLRTFGGQLFELDAHLERLRQSLDITQLSPTQSLSELKEAAVSLVNRNHPLLKPGSDLGLAILVTPGESRGGECNVLMYTDELPFKQMHQWYQEGIALQVSDHRQVPANCWPPELKCRSRMHYYLADQQANRRQTGARALILDQNENIAEVSTANIFIYEQHNGLVSPKDDQILSGISLSVVQTLAEEINIPFSRENITLDRLMGADEVLLCSTSPCVWSASQCNGTQVGTLSNETTATRLQQAWSRRVGMNIVVQADMQS